MPAAVFGLAALDIAKKIGATTLRHGQSRQARISAPARLGHPIDYRNQDWLPVLKQMTNGRGVELVIDPIGGGHWIEKL